MSTEIQTIGPDQMNEWDAYVHNHPRAILYHLSCFQNIIQKTYGHKSYYLMAIKKAAQLKDGKQRRAAVNQMNPINPNNSINSISPSNSINPTNPNNPATRVAGILPLVHLKHFLFGNSLVSVPFFDLGGIIADDEETEKAILSQAAKLGRELKANTIELRHIEPLAWLNKSDSTNPSNSLNYVTKSHKVRMLLDLPDSSEILMKSFKAKLRSQIRKPLKEGLHSKIGGIELLDDFYTVFTVNMRDLGSPVHSKHMIQSVLEEIPEKSHIVMVYKGGQPIACSLIASFKDTLENPWASSLREFSRLSPNMLLYWTMLEYACDYSLRYFDFGRSSPDEGTYKFKEQWGAKPTTLNWHYISLNERPINESTSEKSKFDKAIQLWQKLPVSVANVLGPPIRKHIGL